MRSVHVRFTEPEFRLFAAQAAARHRSLAEHIRRCVATASRPELRQVLDALRLSGPDRTAVQTALQTLWPAPTLPEKLPSMDFETRQKVRDRGALYARRFRRHRRYLDFGERPGHWYLAVTMDAKRLPDGPAKDELLNRAYRLSQDDSHGWKGRFLDLFDPLDGSRPPWSSARGPRRPPGQTISP